ncbi:hypothetical protein HUW62_25760 [Myxococcus sp. AM011]|uniref:hypothetical protein n=1 Tax=Myxococcus sp. AM011 TaxID=2745200 RepID=UPI0015954903|nr:hypothetical protein [Myxococcus sp. AM011]NVJ24639.1 hypothetical protein [Myxococcus sp. AM011]
MLKRLVTALPKSVPNARPYSTRPPTHLPPAPTKSPSRIAQETRARNNSHDLMSDIMGAEDRRHGGNNLQTPRLRPDVLLSRRDNHPFKPIQPEFGTHKAAIDAKGTLLPVDKDGATPVALHVDGKQEYKEKSPFTSFSGLPTGVDGTAPHQLVDKPMYGKNLIVTNPSQEPRGGVVLDPFDIQRDIRTHPDSALDETAVLRSQPRPQPLWQPTAEERALMPSVGVDPAQSSFTYRERALVNTARDQEYLVKGPIREFTLQVPGKDGALQTLSRDELLERARQEHALKKPL